MLYTRFLGIASVPLYSNLYMVYQDQLLMV